jgi:hypothetical protein
MSPRPSRPSAFAPALVACFALAALNAPAGPARAEWLPLVIGNQWQYVDDTEDPHVEVITEQVHVRGRHMFVKSYVGGQDDGLINFWMLDTDGGVLLGGYYRASYPFGLIYEPPVRLFPGSPVVGAEWTTHAIAYSIPDNVFFAEFDLYWAVAEAVSLSPPAGTFQCFGVGQVAPPIVGPASALAPEGQSWGLDGRVVRGALGVLGTGPASATEWYADDIGLVQYNTGVPYVLQSYDVTVPAVASSWGRIKGLYR